MIRSFLTLLLALLIGLPSSARAQFAPIDQAGLSVSLVPSGYEFFTSSDASVKTTRGDIPFPGRPVIKPRTKLSASVVVVNRTRKNIDFHFPDPASAQRKWNFQLLNPEGTEVWRSDSGVFSPQVITPLTLQAGRAWRRSVEIPLTAPIGEGTDAITSRVLPSGTYTIKATLAANPAISASSVIVVRSFLPVPPPAGKGTLSGIVLNADQTPSPFATISVVPIQPPLFPPYSTTFSENQLFRPEHFKIWLAIADEHGRFTVDLPPGKYRANARFGGMMIAIFPPPPVPTGSADVEIRLNETTNTTITLSLENIGPIVLPPIVLPPLIGVH